MHERTNPKQARRGARGGSAPPSSEENFLNSLHAILTADGPEQSEALLNWAQLHLDARGAPSALDPAHWREALELIAPRGSRLPSNPARQEILARLRRSVDAFQRSDGSMAFGPAAVTTSRTRPNRPPLAFATHPGPVRLAIRDRIAGSELLIALDQARPADSGRLELDALGRTWLNGLSTTTTDSSPGFDAEPACWSSWTSGPAGSLAEYHIACGPASVQRSLAWVRARRFLILGDDWGAEPRNRASAATCLRLAPGVTAVPAEDGVGVRLLGPEGTGPGPRLIVPGESTSPGARRRGPSDLVIASDDRPGWQPIFLILDPRLAARTPLVRPLTITEDRRILPNDVASAYRIAWPGQTESLVVYRGRAAAGKRSFLGHQTEARFLVGAFSRKGDLTPIIQLD
jgi:hypothetical protein